MTALDYLRIGVFLAGFVVLVAIGGLLLVQTFYARRRDREHLALIRRQSEAITWLVDDMKAGRKPPEGEG